MRLRTASRDTRHRYLAFSTATVPLTDGYDLIDGCDLIEGFVVLTEATFRSHDTSACIVPRERELNALVFFSPAASNARVFSYSLFGIALRPSKHCYAHITADAQERCSVTMLDGEMVAKQ